MFQKRDMGHPAEVGAGRVVRNTIAHRALVSWGELMFICKRAFFLLAAMVFCIVAASAQQVSAKGVAVFRPVRIDVVVMMASGECVTDLQEQDFKVFDNVAQQPIVFFRAGPISPEGVEIPHLAYAGGARTSGCFFGRIGLFRYEITFNVPYNARIKEYRSVGIRVDRPNLVVVVRARQGYYVQP